jgi:hypothetical protein
MFVMRGDMASTQPPSCPVAPVINAFDLCNNHAALHTFLQYVFNEMIDEHKKFSKVRCLPACLLVSMPLAGWLCSCLAGSLGSWT